MHGDFRATYKCKFLDDQANGVILMPEPRAFPRKHACSRRDGHMTTGGGDGATDTLGRAHWEGGEDTCLRAGTWKRMS